jgi:hypothetical protein
VQATPFPEKPLSQAQENVPGPVEEQVAFAVLQLLVPKVQLLMAKGKKKKQKKNNKGKMNERGKKKQIGNNRQVQA